MNPDKLSATALLAAHNEALLKLRIAAGKAPVWRAIVRRLVRLEQANKIAAFAALRELRDQLMAVEATISDEERAGATSLINEVQSELKRIELDA